MKARSFDRIGGRRVAPSALSWRLVPAVAVLWLAGCASMLPPASPPRAALELPAPTATGAVPVSARWWTSFRDPRLDALVEEALKTNTDLARAVARIDEARAALKLADADRGPAVGAAFDATRQRASRTGAQPVGPSATTTDLRAALNVSYEVDLWGRLASGSRAAQEELAASQFARDALRTSLAAQVVQSYAALQAVDAQLALFRRAVEAQRESVRLQRLRFQSGDLGELDLRQLEAELASNEAQLPRLERSRGATERSLAVLLGRSPKAVWDASIARTAEAVAVGEGVPAGLPSSLLQQRPDVAAAEARLRAAGARVDAARAAYLPGVRLTAAFGKASRDLGDLLDGPSTIWSVIASVTQPIWNAGRLDAGREAVLARERQAELDYRDAVANAFREVRDALEAAAEAQASLELARTRAEALERASKLTQLRFEGGVASRLDAIEAERASLAAQSQIADARRALASAQADVFRALGGGWTAPSDAR